MNSGMFKKGHKQSNTGRTHFKKGMTSWNKGKKGLYKVSEENKEKLRKRMKGNKYTLGRPSWNKGKKLGKNPEHSEWMKKNHTRYWLGRKRPEITGKNNKNWKGGISNNPYPKEFNAVLKLKIRKRDDFTCCLCGRTEREELEELNRVLCVNHIDFNKNNCKENNLNTLCIRCNVKINREREYWMNYFQQNGTE